MIKIFWRLITFLCTVLNSSLLIMKQDWLTPVSWTASAANTLLVGVVQGAPQYPPAHAIIYSVPCSIDRKRAPPAKRLGEYISFSLSLTLTHKHTHTQFIHFFLLLHSWRKVFVKNYARTGEGGRRVSTTHMQVQYSLLHLLVWFGLRSIVSLSYCSLLCKIQSFKVV